MSWRSQWKSLVGIGAAFALLYSLPVGNQRFDNALFEALLLAKEYAREHVLLCLVPAFFIAGAIAVFLDRGTVMRYLGAQANRVLAYGVASVSGSVLAVCSCTVLPIFAGIHRMGAGLGPATAFLYSGPAVNVLAIILTARVLGPKLGIARALGAIFFAILIGLTMHFAFRRETEDAKEKQASIPSHSESRPLTQSALQLGSLIMILVFANWGAGETASGASSWIFAHKWQLTSLAAAALGAILVARFGLPLWKALATALAVAATVLLLHLPPVFPFSVGILTLALLLARDQGQLGGWLEASWGFARQILPLLLLGVLAAGLLLGRTGGEGLIPASWIAARVGGNSLSANLFAALAGALMYFATLTEVPILQGLLQSGMGEGPALALLLAGPAVSLPNMLVIASVIGWRKTSVYITLVVVMATVTGLLYGTFIA